MEEWWKNPALQGADNEYGEYDYLVNELPRNSATWSNWEERCDCCGKVHRLNKVYTENFYTLDGYDSITTEVCWKCTVLEEIHKPLNKIKRWFKLQRDILKETVYTYKTCKRYGSQQSLLLCFKCAKRICTKLNK